LSLTAGILIDTLFGPKLVEALRPGDPVLMAGVADMAGMQALGSISTAKISAAALSRSTRKPILIRRGAFGRGNPARDMLVSPGQKLVVQGRSATAASLIDGRRVVLIHPRRTITFVELQFEIPGILMANGTPTGAKVMCSARPRLAPAPLFAALPFPVPQTPPLSIRSARR
jgi:hypothetical protein